MQNHEAGLIFPRLARNFVKRGYFPTDDRTLQSVLTALDSDAAALRIIDPCCGEGAALASVKQHLAAGGAQVTAWGIEVDSERAWHAKTVLDCAAHSDVADVFVTQRSQGLLWLNPPYGYAVADQAGTSGASASDRLEKQFFRRAVAWLQFGGVMVLIVPYTTLDKEFATLIARHFERVQVFLAPEQQFRQAVVLGVKRRADTPQADVQAAVEAAATGKVELLPDFWTGEPYVVPGAKDEEPKLRVLSIDPVQLEAELQRCQPHTLWPQFARRFSGGLRTPRPPLRRLGEWHLALALASGQVNGLVAGSDGSTLLVKGDTFKDRDRKVNYETRDDGTVIEVVTLTDRFVAAINAIDFTPGPRYGDLVVIR
ncbi:MAG: class I SAM-dependent methyltransferase [Rhodocyclaceae bacterium]|nr:class I SAM-dependent methyltransferase [Rhodocyclaceae bacterium]